MFQLRLQIRNATVLTIYLLLVRQRYNPLRTLYFSRSCKFRVTTLATYLLHFCQSLYPMLQLELYYLWGSYSPYNLFATFQSSLRPSGGLLLH